jgi:hypothetical protein
VKKRRNTLPLFTRSIFKALFYKAELILEDELLAEDCVRAVILDVENKRRQVKTNNLPGCLKSGWTQGNGYLSQ